MTFAGDGLCSRVTHEELTYVEKPFGGGTSGEPMRLVEAYYRPDGSLVACRDPWFGGAHQLTDPLWHAVARHMPPMAVHAVKCIVAVFDVSDGTEAGRRQVTKVYSPRGEVLAEYDPQRKWDFTWPSDAHVLRAHRLEPQSAPGSVPAAAWTLARVPEGLEISGCPVQECAQAVARSALYAVAAELDGAVELTLLGSDKSVRLSPEMARELAALLCDPKGERASGASSASSTAEADWSRKMQPSNEKQGSFVTLSAGQNLPHAPPLTTKEGLLQAYAGLAIGKALDAAQRVAFREIDGKAALTSEEAAAAVIAAFRAACDALSASGESPPRSN